MWWRATLLSWSLEIKYAYLHHCLPWLTSVRSHGENQCTAFTSTRQTMLAADEQQQALTFRTWADVFFVSSSVQKKQVHTIAPQDLFLTSLFTLLHLFKASKHHEQDRQEAGPDVQRWLPLFYFTQLLVFRLNRWGLPPFHLCASNNS